MGTVLNKETAAYKNIIANKPYYGMVDILGKKYITWYVLITDNRNNVIGIWYIGYKVDELDQLAKEVNGMKILDNGFIFVTDNKGVVLFNSQNTKPEIMKSILNDSYDKSEWVAENRVHGETGVRVYAAYPTSDLSARINPVIIFSIISTLAILILIILALYFSVAKWIVKNIEILKTASNKLADGDLNFEIDIQTEDEFGQLAKSFGAMSLNFKNFIEQVNIQINAAQNGKLDIRSDASADTASAEESASAAEELSGQANQLRQLIDKFKLINSSDTYYNISDDSFNSSSRYSDQRMLNSPNNYENYGE